MKLSRHQLRQMILEALLSEAEGDEDKAEEEKPEEESTADEPAEGGDTAETGAESTDDSGEDAPAEEPASEEEGGEQNKGDEGDEYNRSISAVDIELTGVITNIEGAAIEKAAAAEKFAQKSNEALRHQFIRFLFEAEEPTPALDVDTYASEVARLISNYMNLIDMEKVIFDKAYKFLLDKYGKDMADSFKDILDKKFDLNFDQTVDIEKAQPGYDVYAVGAKGASQA